MQKEKIKILHVLLQVNTRRQPQFFLFLVQFKKIFTQEFFKQYFFTSNISRLGDY